MEKIFFQKNRTMDGRKTQKIDIISEYRPFLRILKAFNINNYRYNDRRLCRSNLLILLYTVTLATAEILEFILGVWHFFDHGFILKKIASALPLLISSVQVLSSYATLSLKNHEIDQVLENLQNTIDARCEKSLKSFVIYQGMQTMNARITGILIKWGIFVLITVYIVAASFPISHAIFHYPPPELWTLALDTQ